MSTQEKTLKARNNALQQYVSEMLTVEEHIGTIVNRQSESKDRPNISPETSQIIQRIMRHTEQHAKDLRQHLQTIGGDPAKGIKEMATAALGAVAGLYDKVRVEQVSKMLRDDYIALNLAAVGYSMLHTTGVAVQEHATAALALRHLKTYTSVIMELNTIIPGVVVTELKDNGVVVVENGLQQAVQNTQDVWKPASNGNSKAS